MSVSDVARGVVSGRLDRVDGSGAAPPVGIGLMIDFAEFLALNGCGVLLGPGRSGSVLHVSTHIFGTTHANAVTGECRISTVRPGMVIAETTISEDDSGRIALVTQTLALHDAITGADPGGEANPVIEVGGVLYAVGQPVEEPEINGSLAPQRVDIPATRRQQIFEAATRIITEKGFERATMREIAREAGLTIPTMYQYLKRKDEILELIFDTYLTKIEASLRRAVAGKATATERLTAAVSTTLASLSEHHREIRIMTRDTKSLRPAIRKIVLQRMMTYLSIFTEIVRSGAESGEFRPVDAELYANLIPMVCQVWAQRYWSVGKFGREAVERAILDLAFNGIGNRRDPA